MNIPRNAIYSPICYSNPRNNIRKCRTRFQTANIVCRSWKPKSLYLRVWKHSDFQALLYRFSFSSSNNSNPVVFQLFPESDTEVERYFEILRISNFCFSFVPYLSMHGIIWFHALPCMESYCSMYGIAWNVSLSWFHAWNRMESYWSYGSMHGIAWKPYEFGSGFY